MKKNTLFILIALVMVGLVGCTKAAPKTDPVVSPNATPGGEVDKEMTVVGDMTSCLSELDNTKVSTTIVSKNGGIIKIEQITEITVTDKTAADIEGSMKSDQEYNNTLKGVTSTFEKSEGKLVSTVNYDVAEIDEDTKNFVGLYETNMKDGKYTTEGFVEVLEGFSAVCSSK